ncbi:MAG TPA: MFS transporter [Firmicutes bacterium]|nr:MFS transporter [Candidatus Fermentithermobacillaceae bacterium]
MNRLIAQLSTLREDLSRKDPPDSPALRTERNIRVSTYHGIASIMALNLASPFVSIFAVKMGASNLQVGLLSSAPALMALLSMIPGGKYIDRQKDKKRAVSLFILAQRLFYLLMAAVPFFSPDKRAWVLVLLATLMNAPTSIANVGWQAFISRVIPVERRADAFAARNRLSNLTGTIVVLFAGRLIDMVGSPLGYQIAFAGAFVMTMLEIWVFGRIDDSCEIAVGEGTEASGERTGMLKSIGRELREVFSTGPFLRYTIGSILFYLCWQAPWPLFTLYQVNVLKANNMWVSLLNLANTSGSLMGYGFWVRQIHRHGNLKTLFFSSLWIFVVPLAYAMSKSLLTVAAFNLLTGAVFSGVNLALLNTLLEVTPEKKKATYIAYYTTAVTSSAIVAPMVGVGLLNRLGFFWAFISLAIMRFLGSFVFLLVNSIEKKLASRQAASTSQVTSSI